MGNNDGVSFIITIEKSNRNLRAQLEAMTTTCRQFECGYEVLVFVREGLPETARIIEDFQNAQQIEHETINFFPSALRTGLKRARYERVLVCCSDDIVTVHCIKQMLLGLEHYHLICGVRPVLKQGLRISIYRWLWHKLVRFLFSVRLKDINCPYKALLRSKVEEIGYLESDGTLAHTELIARMKARETDIAEFPLESFYVEAQQPEGYNLIVLIGTLCRLVKLKTQILRTKKRLSNESDFHDAWASTIQVDELLVRESFEAITAIENKHALNTMGDIKGKRVLDLGCGMGEASVYFALKGAIVTAADISPEMIRVVNQLAEKWKTHVNARVMIAEDMDLPSNDFDFVFGNGILHHLDRKKAYNEIYRILKPGGRAVFIEPLCYNPLISIYRVMARTVRTKNEKPFRFRDLRYLRKLFSRVRHSEFWLATQLIFIYFFLIKRASPRKERYWKKVIAEADSITPMYNRLLKIDNWLLKNMPFLKIFCWNTVIVLEKHG